MASASLPQSTVSVAEAAVDEVKVFRSTDNTDDIASSSAELAADKKDLALEAEIESQTDTPAQRNVLQPQNHPTHLQSPSFPGFMLPSPFYMPIFPQQLSPAYQVAAAMAIAPQIAPQLAYNAVAAIAAHSPRFMQQFGTASFMNNALNFQSPFANGLVGMGTLPPNKTTTPQTAPPNPNTHKHLNSPMASVSNVLGGISISAERKLKRDRDRRDDEQRTPKREKREKREMEGERVKKPMNAYMVFMKDNRERFLEQYKSLDGKKIQSADLNKMMGEVWQKMDKAAQQPYFDKANKLREEHQQKHPNWSARENYAIHKKNKKKRREKSLDTIGEQKKCRARFGVDNQEKWCQHCRRKKRCLNVLRDADSPIVSSTTNPTTPSSTASAPQNSHSSLQLQIGSGSQIMGGYPDGHYSLTSCSSSGGLTGSNYSSVGKRSESAHSSASSSSHHSSMVAMDETLVQQQSCSPQNSNNKVFTEMEMPKPTPTHGMMGMSSMEGAAASSAFQFNPMALPFNLMLMNGAQQSPNFAHLASSAFLGMNMGE